MLKARGPLESSRSNFKENVLSALIFKFRDL